MEIVDGKIYKADRYIFEAKGTCRYCDNLNVVSSVFYKGSGDFSWFINGNKIQEATNEEINWFKASQEAGYGLKKHF